MGKRKPVKKLVAVNYSAWGTAINQEAYDLYQAYRSESKKPLSRMTVDAQLELLSGYSHEVQLAMVQQSIAAGWVGLFPPKNMMVPGSSRSTTLEQDLNDVSWAR
jgi:hypothetical protein